MNIFIIIHRFFKKQTAPPSIAPIKIPPPDLLAEPQFSTQNCGRQGKTIPSNAFAERVSEANEGFLGAKPLSPFSCKRSLSGDKECEVYTQSKQKKTITFPYQKKPTRSAQKSFC